MKTSILALKRQLQVQIMQIMLIKFKETENIGEASVAYELRVLGGKNTPQTKTTADMLLRHLNYKIQKKKEALRTPE